MPYCLANPNGQTSQKLKTPEKKANETLSTLGVDACYLEEKLKEIDNRRKNLLLFDINSKLTFLGSEGN